MTAMPTGDSPFDADGHPSVEAISEYTEELLRPDHAERVGAHLADCAPCTETHTALGEIRDLLGRSSAPRLPADVSGRIDAALAAESLLAAELPDITPEELTALEGADEDSAVTGLIAAEEARAAEESDLPIDPAWVRALIGSGLPAPEQPQPGQERQPTAPQDDPQSGTADHPDEPSRPVEPGEDDRREPTGPRREAGSAAGPPPRPAGSPSGPRDGRPPRGPRRFRRGRVGLLAGAGLAVAAAVIGVVVSSLPRPAPSGGASSAAVRASGPGGSGGSAGSGTQAPAVTAAGIPQVVTQMLSDSAAPSTPSNGAMQPHTAAGGGSTGSTGGTAGTRSAPATAATPATTPPGCVLAATGRTGTPLAVEPFSYRGDSAAGGPVPVYVVVYSSDSAAAVDAYVVPASCSGGVLLHREVTRP
jgi:hypothetical protein